MIRLDGAARAEWVELVPGVRVLVEPATTSLMMSLQFDAGAPDPGSMPENTRALAMARAVARAVIREWEGVGDANGKPVRVTPDRVDALLDIWTVYQAFQEKVLAPVMFADAEKNASAPSPAGTSAGATPIAKRARPAAKTARKR